jgi:hypothetical protein
MSLLAVRVGAVVLAVLAVIALRGKRWAYLAFVVLGLLYFPAQTQFRVRAPTCEQVLPTTSALLLSLQNYVLIALFAAFCWMSWVQFARSKARFVWAVLATVLAGVLVEVAEDMTGRGSCRLRDLVPAGAGAVGAALVLALVSRLFRKPGYVRIVRPRSAAAPLKPAIPQRPPATPPPPPDFSPTAGALPADLAPTEEVAPIRRAVRPGFAQRLEVIRQRLFAILQRLWGGIRGRRRAIAVVVTLLVLVGAAAVFILTIEAPPPAVTEQPTAAPAPPPRPLQSEAEGYYEPSYPFSVADRRFTRLTLRPEPFVTFSRIGTRQEAGCTETRVGRDGVRLRCELDRVGTVTIDGRFTSRFVTNRLDTPVLSALITVTNTRGEVLYRARDSFRWHAPD